MFLAFCLLTICRCKGTWLGEHTTTVSQQPAAASFGIIVEHAQSARSLTLYVEIFSDASSPEEHRHRPSSDPFYSLREIKLVFLLCTASLRYADDTVLIAENEKDLQQLLDIVKEESEKKGLELNRKKTEVMVVSRKQELPIINIYIKGTRLKQKDQFKYLGSLISSDGRNNSEVASRIAQAKTNFQKMKTVLTNKNISIRTRRRALECYIEPILMYGCEAWTISKQTQKKLEATEMWFLRRMLRISWTAKKTNDTVLEEAHTTRLLISKIRKRQATFFGHVMRREKLENLVTTGMLEGKRSRGKQREKLIEGLTDWLKAGKSLEAIEATKDLIANAVKQGT
ncbi:endonuclease-reverse transcriptase [Plakobranchus ocellatus]|uniref:Endonuclease-reverse transcriptase n=1 Tax=Plakobranchus ocellatus TaxID=259542 RepID=A0AAV4BR46_9GAST|nr:endonuclease-reverse transcriptase [Plakobranchus ocellatus]